MLKSQMPLNERSVMILGDLLRAGEGEEAELRSWYFSKSGIGI